MKETQPLSGKGTLIKYKEVEGGFSATWGDNEFEIDGDSIQKIRDAFFVNPKAWYPLGASESPISPYGLGEFIQNLDINLTARHSSAVAAILVAENKLSFFQKGKGILLQKKSSAS
jgi:hypothetical protein